MSGFNIKIVYSPFILVYVYTERECTAGELTANREQRLLKYESNCSIGTVKDGLEV